MNFNNYFSLLQKKPILGCTYTFLKKIHLNNPVTTNGDKTENRNRSKQEGSGILLYIQGNMNYKRHLESAKIEVIWN